MGKITNYLKLAKHHSINASHLLGSNNVAVGCGFGIEAAELLSMDTSAEEYNLTTGVANLVDDFHSKLFQSNVVGKPIVKLQFGAGLENYDSLSPQESLLNTQATLAHDLNDLVEKSGIPELKRPGVVAELMALLDNLQTRLTAYHFVSDPKLSAEGDGIVLSTSRLVGAENAGTVATEGRITRALLSGDADARKNILNTTSLAGMESFGVDSDKLLSDTRTAMVVILRRAMSSVTRRALHVVPHADPVIKIAKVHPEIFDLNNMKSEKREERGRFINALTLYHFPDQVVTTNTKVVLDQANDDEDVMYDTNSIKIGKKYSLKSLGAKRDANGIRSPLDQSDLIDEAPRMDFIKVLVTFNDGTVSYSEVMRINLHQYQERAKFIVAIDEEDANTRVLNRTFKGLTLSRTTDTAASSDIFDVFDSLNAKVRFDLNVNAELVLWSGDGFTNAFIMSAEAFMADGTSATAAVQTQLGYLTITPVSAGLDARWRQENLRETSTFARMRHSSMAFTIPTGKAFGVTSSIQQQSPGTDQAISSMLNELINLGNDAKHIASLSSSLASLKSRLDPDNRIPGDYAEMTKRLTYDYIGGTLVNPTVLDMTIDVAALGTTTLREQERAEDKTSAVTRQIINAMAHAKTQSLLQRQIEPGEQIVWHGIVGRPLIDLVYSIPLTKQSQQVLSNRSVAGADLEISLPNGDLLRLFANDHANFINKSWFLPMRSDPQSPLNYATIRDCGVFTYVYTNTNSGAVDNRAIATSREVVLPQCPVAICMQFKNLEYFETQYNQSSSGITMDLYSSIPRIRTEDGSTVTTINGDTESYSTIYSQQNP